jgi:hypothetical protein
MKANSGSIRTTIVYALSLFLVVVAANGVTAQGLLYSFETPDNPGTPAVDESLEGFGTGGFATPVSLGVSTEAATDGTHGLKIEKQSGYTWDAVASINAADTVRYPLWNQAAGNLAGFALDFDVVTTADSFSHVTLPSGGYMLLDVAVNSASPNFPTVYNVSPPGNFINTASTFHVSIPMTSLPVAQNSGYYQLSIGSNSSSFPESGVGIRYFVDNIRFKALAPPKQTVSSTIFSWETPDNPSTPTVDERFEGWTEGYQPGHTHSIVTAPAHGPTDGTHALNIHRVDLDNAPDDANSAFFTWGSQYVLNSDPNQNGQIDTAIQGKINSLAAKLNSATRVAFDVSFDPSAFDASPTYAKFGLSFDDGTHSFQTEFPFFSPQNATSPTTLTMDLPLTAFTQGSLNLDQTGIANGTHSLRIVMSTNVNGLFAGGSSTPIDFQVDNFRLITEVSGVPGDYDNDGVVDAGDYVAWRKAMATPSTQLLNEVSGTTPGVVTTEDYAAWRARFGNTTGAGSSLGASSAVPEPSGIALSSFALVALLGASRRKV